MSSKVLITEHARSMLEKEQERRINENWKRGYSLEQIASEAIVFWFNQGDADRFKNENSVDRILKEGGNPVSEEGF